MSELQVSVTTSTTSNEKKAESKVEKTPVERIPTPDIISAPPAPEAAKVTTVKDESKKVSSSQLSPKMSSGQTTKTTRKQQGNIYWPGTALDMIKTVEYCKDY